MMTEKWQANQLGRLLVSIATWVTLIIVVGLCSSCASGANMREARITVNLPPGMTAIATVDAEGKGVPAVQVNIGNTTRTVDIETAREASATIPMAGAL